MSRSALQDLARMVVKQGVGIGLLTVQDQALVFALAWAGLPRAVMTEPQVNEQLRAQLAAPLAFLNTDHVELRRWLVDAAWLHRDGFGREYRACTAEHLPAAGAVFSRELAHELAAMDAAAWVAQQRAGHVAVREARRAHWLLQQAGAAA